MAAAPLSAGALNAQWRQIVKEVLMAAWSHRDAWIFHRAVIEADGLTVEEKKSYALAIKTPMDFRTVKQNIPLYPDLAAFEHDMQLVFGNCAAFNRPGQDAYDMGQAVATFFAKKWAEKKPLAQHAYSQLCTLHNYTPNIDLYHIYKYKPPVFDVTTNKVLAANRPAGKIPPLFSVRGDEGVPTAAPFRHAMSVPLAGGSGVPIPLPVRAPAPAPAPAPAQAPVAAPVAVAVAAAAVKSAVRISVAGRPGLEDPARKPEIKPETATQGPSMAELWKQAKEELREKGAEPLKRVSRRLHEETGTKKREEEESKERRAVALHWASKMDWYLRRSFTQSGKAEAEAARRARAAAATAAAGGGGGFREEAQSGQVAQVVLAVGDATEGRIYKLVGI